MTKLVGGPRKWLLLLACLVPLPALAALSAVPDAVDIGKGERARIQIFGAKGRLRLSVAGKDTVEAELKDGVLRVKGEKAGSAVLRVRDGASAVSIPVTVTRDQRSRSRSDDGEHDGGGSGGGGSGGGGGSYTLLGWNDLGMHCMDADYSVFSILPPYNNLHAQLIDRSTGRIVTQGVTLTFEALADPDGSINSSSVGKTNFWQYAKDFFGVTLPMGEGLAGYRSAESVPQALDLDAARAQFVAEGVPITPYDDALAKNFYPLVRVAAHDAAGNLLAEARVVLPVSDEMTCVGCHASGSVDAARPAAGWVGDPDPERDYRRNVLRLHDEQKLPLTAYKNALTANGYAPAGLLATADGGRAILCASCHASNALPGTGIDGISSLTQAMHSQHDQVVDPRTGVSLGDSDNRGACYQCHPGSETRCLRGVMGNAVQADGSLAMQCQSCHGGMAEVGSSGRVGWFDQPNCQACHHDGQREVSARTAAGALKSWSDTRYATEPDVPVAGFSLYRFSKGHGGLQCEACHGATHAEYPSSHRNDNLLALDVQGREGSIGECASCHASVPMTADGGPHGMHTLGSAWVGGHERYAERSRSGCAYCHGPDYRGSELSQVAAARSFRVEGRTVSYAAGQTVGCYDCHNGPGGD